AVVAARRDGMRTRPAPPLIHGQPEVLSRRNCGRRLERNRTTSHMMQLWPARRIARCVRLRAAHRPEDLAVDQRQLQRSLEKADRSCRERGTRLTAVRRRVLELILEAGQPVGAYALLGRLEGRPTPTTVYRAID